MEGKVCRREAGGVGRAAASWGEVGGAKVGKVCGREAGSCAKGRLLFAEGRLLLLLLVLKREHIIW